MKHLISYFYKYFVNFFKQLDLDSCNILFTRQILDHSPFNCVLNKLKININRELKR